MTEELTGPTREGEEELTQEESEGGFDFLDKIRTKALIVIDKTDYTKSWKEVSRQSGDDDTEKVIWDTGGGLYEETLKKGERTNLTLIEKDEE